MKPMLTVIMPVYNAEKYLQKAIKSVLNQSFVDFNLIIVNDGSSDNSQAIIEQFNDKRLTLIINKKNKGLIVSLNEAVKLAKGKYIARMDADDICLPERFEKQITFLEKNPEIAVLATKIELINPENESIGFWDLDQNTNTPQEIKKMMAKSNCIAHPSIVIKTEIAQKYLYSKKQKASEDWDLWLRLLADNQKIAKLNEVLLKYRIHKNSVTQSFKKKQTAERKSIFVKTNFLIHQTLQFKINQYFILVLYSLLRSIARDFKFNILPKKLSVLKRLITISPLQAFSEYQTLKKTMFENNTSEIFLFFPYTHVGGAEKVHAQICETLAEVKPWIFFTGFSLNDNYLPKFENSGKIINKVSAINHPFFKSKTEKLILNKIEACQKPIVFGCNSLFFYDAILKLSQKVNCIDLIHDFRFEGQEAIVNYFIDSYLRCNSRVFISNRAIEQTKIFYKKNGISNLELSKLKFIQNYVDVNNTLRKNPNENLKIIFVGRQSPEKRIHLVEKVIDNLFVKEIPFEFYFVGPLNENKKYQTRKNIKYLGEINDSNKLNQIYFDADVLLLTSEREGFPMVIMEAMANGVIPISTPVGDIIKHIKNGKNGYLTSEIDEQTVINEISEKLYYLISNRPEKENISKNAHQYALTHFSKVNFYNAYHQLFELV